MKDWFEIFSAGRHEDSQGRVRDWSEQDLDHAVKAYDPTKHEAPIVIGHPADNAPAYGWIEAVRREGSKLLAKPKQVVKEFADAVKQGMFKKRSVSFYPDGTLRHVGFLGAQPPAVKGLKDLAFDSGEYHIEYEYAEQAEPPANPPPNPEEDMNRVQELEAQLEQERKAKEAAEQAATAAQAKADQAAADHAEAQRKAAQDKREARFAALVKDSKALPGEKPAVMAFAGALGNESEIYEFSDGSGKKPLEEHFWAFLEGRGSHGLFHDVKPEDPTEKDRQEFAEDEKTAEMIVGKTDAE